MELHKRHATSLLNGQPAHTTPRCQLALTEAGPTLATLADTGCAVLHAGGITPGFRMRDAASGTLAGPPAHAELAPKLGIVEARFTPVDIPLAKAAQAALRLSS